MENVEFAPKTVSERIAALQNQGESDAPSCDKPMSRKNNSVAGLIAALQKSVESSATANGSAEVGKLKAPPGIVPVMVFGSGLPQSLMQKKKERESQSSHIVHSSEDVENALLLRPTIKGGKRRPRKHVSP